MTEQSTTTGTAPLPPPLQRRWLRRLLPSTADVIFLVLVLILLFGRPNQYFFLDGDPGWHIRAGQHILETGTIPKNDFFSFSMPHARWVMWEWGMEVIFAFLHQHFGLNGVVFFVVLLLASTYALLYRFFRQDGFTFLLSFFLLLFVILTSSIHWVARPHVVSYLFVILFYRILDGFMRQRIPARRLWVLPALMILWVNLHAGFIAGIVLAFTFFISSLLAWAFSTGVYHDALKREVRLTGGIAGACLLAALINPNGYGLFTYMLDYFRTVHRLNPINELLSPSFQIPAFQPFLLAILGLLFLLRYSRYRVRLEECLNLVVWMAMALISARNIPVMLLICAPIYARLLEGLQEPFRSRGTRTPRMSMAWRRFSDRVERVVALERDMNRHVLAILLILFLLVIVGRQGYLGSRRVMDFRFLEDNFPVRGVENLKANPPQGNVFNEVVIGGFLIYKFYPHIKVFVDGRLDMYGEPFTRQYVKLINAPEVGPGGNNWKEIFKRYKIQWVMIRPDFTLRYVLETDPGWQLRYIDAQCVIFVQKSLGTGH